MRHTMAVSYLRNGGHSSLDMTRKYAELSQTDVIEKHRQFSPADRLESAEKNGGRRKLR